MSQNNLKRDFPRIFLTDELGEVNWCQDRITVEDVEYVPVSDLLAAQAEVTRLLTDLERSLTAACEQFLSANGSAPPLEWRRAVVRARAYIAPKEPS